MLQLWSQITVDNKLKQCTYVLNPDLATGANVMFFVRILITAELAFIQAACYMYICRTFKAVGQLMG